MAEMIHLCELADLYFSYKENSFQKSYNEMITFFIIDAEESGTGECGRIWTKSGHSLVSLCDDDAEPNQSHDDKNHWKNFFYKLQRFRLISSGSFIYECELEFCVQG